MKYEDYSKIIIRVSIMEPPKWPMSCDNAQNSPFTAKFGRMKQLSIVSDDD